MKGSVNVAVVVSWVCWMEPSFGLSFSVPLSAPGNSITSQETDCSFQSPPGPNPTLNNMKAITKKEIDDAIDVAIRSDNLLMKELQKNGLTISRAKGAADWDEIVEFEEIRQDNSLPILDDMTPWFFGMEIWNAEEETTDEGKLCGVLTFYVAFSSWNGRIMYLDRLKCSKMNGDIEKLFLRILAQIASELQFARLTWRHKETPQWYIEGRNQPEMHGEVLTLVMDKEALASYVKSSVGRECAKVYNGSFHRDAVDNAIQGVIVEANTRSSESSKFRLRLAQQSDIETMSRLVQALADYVKEPDAVLMTAENYKQDGYCDDPLFICLIVDHVEDDGSTCECGFAICYFGYELGKGRFLYLEDLFLELDYRQGGGGSMVMSTLAQICQSVECSHLYWQALDWNTAGLKFYNKIGAKILNGVKTSRYCGDAMTAFAADGTG